MIIAVTGHRPDKLGREYDLKGVYSDYIRAELSKVIEDQKPTQIVSGMALGVDTIWALLALEHNIPLLAAIPFTGQENIWVQKSKDLYNTILSHPLTEKIIVNDGGYAAWKMQTRNVWMVDRCDKLVAVWNGTPGGTKNCVDYARKINKDIIVINPMNAIS